MAKPDLVEIRPVIMPQKAERYEEIHNTRQEKPAEKEQKRVADLALYRYQKVLRIADRTEHTANRNTKSKG